MATATALKRRAAQPLCLVTPDFVRDLGQDLAQGRVFSACSTRHLFVSEPHETERGRSSGVEHNLAKVRVESSNLFARSSWDKQYQGFKKRPPGRFLLT